MQARGRWHVLLIGVASVETMTERGGEKERDRDSETERRKSAVDTS